MNPLRPPSASSRVMAGKGRAGQVTAGKGKGAFHAGFGSVRPPVMASTDGSSQAAVEPATVAVTTSPPLASLQAAGFPAYWTSSSPLGASEGIYPPGGFSNFLQSNGSLENFHLVGNTTSRATISPTAPSLKRRLESNAEDKETINVDADETNKDVRTERRLNWTKPEDVRLMVACGVLLRELIASLKFKHRKRWSNDGSSI